MRRTAQRIAVLATLRCGTIIEAPAERLTSALEHAIEGSAFTLSDQAGLTLHGLCPDCQP